MPTTNRSSMEGSKRTTSKLRPDRGWKLSDIVRTKQRGPTEEFVALYNVPEATSTTKEAEPIVVSGEGGLDDSTSAGKGKGGGTTRRHSLPVPVEYQTLRFRPAVLGVDLEVWWRKSVDSVRFNVIFAMLLLAIAIAYFAAGIIFISNHFAAKTPSPYLCENLECQKASNWLAESMNESVDPCENFYDFACGSYKEELGEDKEFVNIIEDPAFKLEFGQDSYLSKILKNFKNDQKQDQPIQFYQSCLDQRNRSGFGMGAFQNMIREVFGTTNFLEFETSASASDLEEIGAKLFRVMGHAVYLTMSFYAYPYIEISQFNYWMLDLEMKDLSSMNAIFTKQLATKLLISVGTPANSTVIDEMLEGIRVFSVISANLADFFVKNPDVNLTDLEALKGHMSSQLSGLCPPMGVKLDVYKVFDKFTGENSRKYITYFDFTAEGFLKGLDICFNEDPSKFSSQIGGSHPKTGFVGMWVLGLFVQFVEFMDSKILASWELPANSKFGVHLQSNLDRTPEFQCLVAMWKALGFLPSIRFLESQPGDDIYILQKAEENIARIFEATREEWLVLPHTMDERLLLLGDKLFERGLQSHLMMPLEGGRVDYNHDVLPFTADHLHNSLIGMAYSIAGAKNIWSGSTNTCPCSKWFGRGFWGFRGVHDELVSLLSPMKVGARLVTETGAVRNDKWVNFLRRKPTNYVLFPMTLVNEPHSTESLALEHAGTTIKIVRSILGLLREALYPVYGKYRGPSGFFPEAPYQIWDMVDWPWETMPQSSETCRRMDSTGVTPYLLTRTQSDRFVVNLYFNIITVKFALHIFREERIRILSRPPTWSEGARERRVRMQRTLPGKLANLSEEQLFFLTFVRHVCRGSWIKFPDSKSSRYRLEATILNIMMGMKEFSDVWKCSNTSFLNLNNDVCLKWIP